MKWTHLGTKSTHFTLPANYLGWWCTHETSKWNLLWSTSSPFSSVSSHLGTKGLLFTINETPQTFHHLTFRINEILESKKQLTFTIYEILQTKKQSTFRINEKPQAKYDSLFRINEKCRVEIFFPYYCYHSTILCWIKRNNTQNR